MARERLGRLLDRGTAATQARLASGRRAQERLADRLGPTLPARLATARATLAEGGAALAVLGPQATLDRGYAIVRRADDARIIRDPDEAPAGTTLQLRVARGELPATASKR